MKKKFILLTVVIIEILILSFFGFKIWPYLQGQTKDQQNDIVTTIPSAETTHLNDEEFEYYYKFQPGSWKEKPDWLPYSVTYHINKDGLREFENYPIDKSDNTFRIITLGDSLTYGQQVNGADVWTEKLEKQLNEMQIGCGFDKFEVINLGMPGFDVQYIVKHYKDLGQKYSPNLILWFETGHGFLRHNELTKPIVDKCFQKNSSKLPTDSLSMVDYDIYNECFNEASLEIIEEYGQTELDQLLYDEYDKFFGLAHTDRTVIFFSFLPENNISFLERVRQKHPELTYIRLLPKITRDMVLPDGHPTVKTHQLIANQVTEYLTDKFFSCD